MLRRTLIFALAAVAPSCATAPAATTAPTTAPAALAHDAAGWSILPAYARSIYADSTAGSDANAGTTPAAPVRTLAAAYRLMAPGTDLCLLRGDVWHETFPGYWHWDNSALTAYGTVGADNRPLIIAPVGGNVLHLNGAANVVIDGIHFEAGQHDPTQPATYSTSGGGLGIEGGTGCTNLLVEGCRVEFFYQGISLSGGAGVTLRRNVVNDCHVNSTAHAQGLWTDGAVSGFASEQNLYDHNGWAESSPGVVVRQADMFSQFVRRS